MPTAQEPLDVLALYGRESICFVSHSCLIPFKRPIEQAWGPSICSAHVNHEQQIVYAISNNFDVKPFYQKLFDYFFTLTQCFAHLRQGQRRLGLHVQSRFWLEGVTVNYFESNLQRLRLYRLS